MDELTAFLRARLDEDEAAAKAARPAYFTCECLAVFSAAGDIAHVLRHDPARVLRDVEAKRAILKRYEHAVSGELPEWTAGRELISAAIAILFVAIRELTAVYSDHPDYRQEWKP